MLKIYPKKGKPFDLEFDHFEIEGEQFTLHRTPNSGVSGYLTIREIAAIIPSSLRPLSERRDLRVFTVYLRQHLDSPICVTANRFEKDSSLVIFHYRHYEMKEIYIATEDVLGITFADLES